MATPIASVGDALGAAAAATSAAPRRADVDGEAVPTSIRETCELETLGTANDL